MRYLPNKSITFSESFSSSSATAVAASSLFVAVFISKDPAIDP
jgi:hypothetical protein